MIQPPQTGGFSLTGPLSRNDRIRALLPGDSVQVKILERLDSHRAIIDLYGNKIEAHFDKGLPRNDSLALTVKVVSAQNLSFVLSEKGSEVKMDFLREVLSSIPFNSPGGNSILQSARAGMLSIYSILFQSAQKNTAPVSADSVRRFARYLLDKGVPPERVPFASALMGGVSAKEMELVLLAARLLSDLQTNTGEDPTKSERTLTQEDLSLLQNRGKGDNTAFFAIPCNDSLAVIQYACAESSVAGEIDLPSSGHIEFFIRGNSEKCGLILVCEKHQTKDDFVRNLDSLRQSIQTHYRSVDILCVERREWAEKVLAFAGLNGQSSFNVIA